MTIQPFEQSKPRAPLSPENAAELQVFRQEIDAIVAEEKAHPENAQHLALYPNFATAELNVADMEIWNKVKAGTISLEEYRAWQHEVEEEVPVDLSAVEQGIIPSRKLFARFVMNQATPIFGNKYLDQAA